ncbi:MAG: SDR family oxidoreductase [Acidobacteria bacterium]|nr:SDR family oxidoreductase [Acidobacteriota bacterium]
MNIAITGSTGHLGRLVIEKLTASSPKARLVALARTPSKASDLGIAVREADYDRPETLGPALAGVDTLLLISGNELGKRAVQHERVLEAAREAGVSRVVYTSLLHADTSPLSLAPEHLETEKLIEASGIPYTILRNGWYVENYTASIGPALAHGALVGSAGDGRVSWATRADYAEAAALVLTAEGHAGRTYELAGDEGYTLSDLAAEVSRQAGKAIPYHNLPEAEYAQVLMGVGLPEAYALAIASWDVDASNGALFDDGHELSRLIGRPTTSLERAVGAALAGLSVGAAG